MSDRATTYRLHGWRVRSEIALAAPMVDSTTCDIDVAWGEAARIPDHAPEGRAIAARRFGDGRGYDLVATPGGYVARFHRLCEFRMDDSRSRIRAHLDPEADPGMAGIFLSGNVAALLLGLAGHACLHASAVDAGRGVVAFVGQSGAGKSTLAALCCARGAALIADDVLRVEADESGCRCFHGTTEIRLRAAAAALAAGLAQEGRATADGRIGVLSRPKPPEVPLPLAAIVLPRLSRSCETLRVQRLAPRDAHFHLVAHPRIAGWLAIEPQRRQFSTMAAVAERVPVYAADIPVGPPFDADLPDRLFAALATRDS